MPSISRKLTSNLVNDRPGSAADCLHGHRGKQKRHQSANKKADDHKVIGKIEVDNDVSCGQRMRIVGEKNQRSQRSRADCITLGYRLGSITNRVEPVRNFTHFRAGAQTSPRCRLRCP